MRFVTIKQNGPRKQFNLDKVASRGLDRQNGLAHRIGRCPQGVCLDTCTVRRHVSSVRACVCACAGGGVSPSSGFSL